MPSGEDASNAPSTSEDHLVGGYLLAGASMDRLDTRKVACGATLIAPRVVVTAAHCVIDIKTTFAFGTGDVGSGQVVEVVERHAHPEVHPVAQGDFDLTHALHDFDSVTQSFTDCVGGTQFLDGYESMFGYGDFLRARIKAVT